MPQGSSAKRERQYEHIKAGAEKRGTSQGRAKEIAARTVNKERAARSGESKTASKTSTQDKKSAPQRGGERSHSGGEDLEVWGGRAHGSSPTVASPRCGRCAGHGLDATARGTHRRGGGAQPQDGEPAYREGRGTAEQCQRISGVTAVAARVWYRLLVVHRVPV